MRSCLGATQRIWLSLVLGAMLLCLNACQSSTNIFLGASISEAGSSLAPVAQAAPQEATPTAPYQDGQDSQPDPSPDQVSAPTLTPGSQGNPSSEPLRFAFPTMELAPNSAWRPALYPVPWALTSFDHFYFTRPIAADDVNWPLADYRFGGVFFENVVHSGVDIPVDTGTPVLAAGSGKVTWTGYGLNSGVYDESDPYGLAISIRHNFGYAGYTLHTVYGHLSQIEVVKGQLVESGDFLGLSGQTGKSTGPHLHFEVRLEKDDVFSMLNPELWLVPPQGWGVLAGRVLNSGGRRLEGQLVAVKSRESSQVWKANSYSGLATSDQYYQENLVISDLPAGRYEVLINYLGKNYTMEIEVLPGRVSTFTFRGHSGFTLEPLPLPGSDFSP